MNRIVLIGNGFDMAHGLKTSYMDFINWYWDKRIDAFAGNTTKVSEDRLCKLTIKDGTNVSCWNVFTFEQSYFRDILGNRTCSGHEVIKELEKHPEVFSIDYCPFFKRIMESFETKRWVDIENDYYYMLKKMIGEVSPIDYTIEDLNEQMGFLQEKLVEYLRTIEVPEAIGDINKALTDYIYIEDLSIEGKELAKTMGIIEFDTNTFDDNRYIAEHSSGLSPERTMLLCFNYTGTAKMYEQYGGLILNYIHGELNDPEHIIFGYGDELDKDYQGILEKNDNELLKNVKSVKYLETRNYHMMLDFLMAAPFQVLIMGHSCGNSDRTLLNSVFEHENCVSIKPFYHKWEDGSDNYLELVQNISRNLTNMRLFRDRVVNKEQCKTM